MFFLLFEINVRNVRVKWTLISECNVDACKVHYCPERKKYIKKQFIEICQV